MSARARGGTRLRADRRGGPRLRRSVGDWPAFADSPEALAQLKRRFQLAVITNCDDDLFAASNRRLGVEFDSIITAEQARGYKPRTENFEFAFERIDVPRERILHVAQSLFHDHVPAKALGMTSVWIDRRQGKAGGGATPPADATPDARFGDLASFASAASAVGCQARGAIESLYTHGFARVAAAVPHVRPAEPVFNVERTLGLASRASDERAALVVFPELGLSAYSNDDHFHQDAVTGGCGTPSGAVAEASRECCP